MEQCLGCGLTPLLPPHWCYSLPPPFPPVLFSPDSLLSFAGPWAHITGKGRSIWTEVGLAVVVNEIERSGPALRRTKETLTCITFEIRCGVNGGLKMITLSCFSSKVMLTVVICLPSHLLFHKSACMWVCRVGTVAVTLNAIQCVYSRHEIYCDSLAFENENYKISTDTK